MTLDLGVLISGRGSNLQAVLDAIAARRLDARVRVVVSNRPGAQGFERAAAAGVPTRVVDHKSYADRAAFERALIAELRAAGVEWVVLAGFMRILTAELLGAFPARVVNIHPSLLPAFPGVDAQAQALAYGVRVTGCTVHLVDEGVDCGPILAQATLPVRADDTRETLAERLLDREHQLLVGALQWIAEGRVTVEPAAPGARARVVVRGVDPLL